MTPTFLRRFANPLLPTSSTDHFAKFVAAKSDFEGIIIKLLSPRTWLLAALFALPIAVQAQQFTTVVLSGAAAPGTPGGVTFASFAGVPSINASGQVAFRATVTGTGITIGTNETGLWSTGAGSLGLLARGGDAAPGVADAGVTYVSGSGFFNNIGINASGQSFFVGFLTGPGIATSFGGNDVGIWSGTPGGVGLAVRSGEPAPGLTGVNYGGGGTTNVPSFNNAGQTVFRSFLNDGRNSLWLGAPGSLALVALQNEQAPGVGAGVTYNTIIPTTGAATVNASGQIAFLTSLQGTGVTTANDRAFYAGTPGSLVLVAREADTAPGTGGATYGASGVTSVPTYNSAGQVSFRAALTTGAAGVTFSNETIFYSGAPGSLAVLAREGDAAVGTDGLFGQLLTTAPALNANGTLAFSSALTGGTTTTANDTGIWAGQSGSLLKVVQEGAAAPGTTALFGQMTGNTLALNDMGQIIFSNTLTGTGVDTTNDGSIWLADAAGTLSLIAREGAAFDVATGDTRTLASLAFLGGSGDEPGVPCGFNDAGQLAYFATFTDGSSGTFIASIESPQTTPNFVVNSIADTDDGTCSNFDCTLREAITAANANADASSITFDATVFANDESIALTGVLPDLSEDVTITGPAIPVTVYRDTGGDYRIFKVATGKTVSLSNMILLSGNATAADPGNNGGAIYNDGTLSLTNCTLDSNNADAYGGAIFSTTGHSLTLTNCTLSNNTAFSGAIWSDGPLSMSGCTVSTNTSTSDIGGIYTTSTATIVNSLFTGNTSVGFGGGIYNGGPMLLTNCTLTGNSSSGAGGGGIYNASTLTVNNCTLSGNSSNTGGGGIFNDGGTMTLNNSIVARNTTNGAGPDIRKVGGTLSGDYNLIFDVSSWSFNTGGTNNKTGQDPLLYTEPAFGGNLADNGGPTQTIRLLAGSPAIDAGSDALLPADTLDMDGDSNTTEVIPFDQRGTGRLRIGGSKVDIGAYEIQNPDSFEVNVTGDGDDGACTVGDCSLREAINAANEDSNVSTISFDATVFVAAESINVTGGLPELIYDVTITGPAAGVNINDDGSGGHIFKVGEGTGTPLASTVVSLSNLTLTGAHTNGTFSLAGRGGAIHNVGTLSLTNCTLDGNIGGHAGAIYSNGPLTMTDCAISDNSAAGSSGGIFAGDVTTLTNCTFTGNTASAGSGGAISYGGSANSLTMTNCTLDGNSALNRGAISGLSGTMTGCTISNNTGTANYGGIFGSGTIINSTFTGNTTPGDAGAIYNNGGTTLTNCTVSGNSAGSGGGIYDTLTLTLNNTIVANNTATGIGPDINHATGAPLQGDYNLIETTGGWTAFSSGGTHNIIGDPLLGALANNGGLTKTLALQAGSLAFNAGSNALAVDASSAALTTDQRGVGFARVSAAIVDIGAFETIIVNNAPVLNNTGDVTLTVQGQGTSIADLLATGAGGDPISDANAGAVEGIAITAAVTTFGAWQYSLDSGGSWQALGTVSSTNARLLSSNGATTRLRFLPTSSTAVTRTSQLTFRAWDQTSSANGALANPTPNGGTTAFSTATETVKIVVPTDAAAPTVTVTNPVHDQTYAVAPTQTDGTASDANGVQSVTCRLYRHATVVNAAGYWNGTGWDAVYSAAIHEFATSTTNAYAAWTLPLPAVTPGIYYLRAYAKDGVGKVATKTNVFTVNDLTPQVAITAPAHNSTQLASALTQAVGTADDDQGISEVRLRLYRYPTYPNTVGFWNGTGWDAVYSGASHERLASTGDAFAHWTYALPVLTPGKYYLQATATDALGNSKKNKNEFTISDLTPQLSIDKPQHNTTYLASALTQAEGTSSDGNGIGEVRLLLYRYATYPNTVGFWSGTGWDAAYSVASHEHLAATGDAFAHWTYALPVLTPGKYYLRATAIDTLGNSTKKLHVFYINDLSPTVTISTPAHNNSYMSSALTQAEGTASDVHGIGEVRVRLYRYGTSGNTVGYWNGTDWDAVYSGASHERLASTVDGFANWTYALPSLATGQYYVRVVATDTLGNTKAKLNVFNVTNTGSLSAVTLPGAVLDSMSASASASSVYLDFTGGVPSTFTVKVNGKSVTAQTIKEGQSVTLLLPDNSLKSGDKVSVTWSGGGGTVTVE